MDTTRIDRYFLAVFIAFTTFVSGMAQGTSVIYDLGSLSENNKLEVFNRKVTTFSENDKNCIRFSKKANDGVAWLKHVIFSNGIIEADIRGKDEFQQSFPGIAFHGSDSTTMDVVYFRPFNFQTTDSARKIHAVQYVSLPEFSWEVLRDKFNGKYEKAVIPAPEPNGWFHVKIIVKYPHITVFVNGNHEPCLEIEALDTRTSGKIGLWVGNNSDGDFASLQITSLE